MEKYPVHPCCAKLPNLSTTTECGTTQSKSPFKVWQDSAGVVTVYNRRHDDVTEYFDISIVNGTVVMNYKKTPSLEEWRKIVGK